MMAAHIMAADDDFLSVPGGTGDRFARAVVILAGVAALFATLVTAVSVWLQTKNYRKPMLQRYVVRILLMVPIYSASSWASLISLKAASWIGPFRDVYEAFTIYTFFQLLINFIGGERALIVLMHGRPPVSHLWPLNALFAKVDISDPHTFLAIKRGILQYTWIKPMLAIAAIAMKATGIYQEGYIGLSSGYLWSGLIYNISITICLYALALFWVCMSHDLEPFRPMPKFLCIKGIIFASYWQGFFLSILVWLHAIPGDVPGYTPDNLAAAVQDALICFEMPLFAMAHWYAFSWHDYADVTVSSARMPVKFALRDAFGPRDLIEDTKETFGGGQYEYRYFDADDNVLAHEESSSRTARMMEGMRYARGGRGKYWIPKPSQEHEPLLAKMAPSRARTMSPGARQALEEATPHGSTCDDGEAGLNPEDEGLFDSARALEFGDWNYPVITAHTASREDGLYSDPRLVTPSTNRNILQPTTANRERRKSQIQRIQQSAHKGKHKHRSEPSCGEPSSANSRDNGRHEQPASSGSSRSQLVDLVVEDHEAEETERVRARKEGGSGWNEAEPKHFVRTYPREGEEEDVRSGFDPDELATDGRERAHNLDAPLVPGEPHGGHGDEARHDGTGGGGEEEGHSSRRVQYGSFGEERNVWND